MLSSLRIIAVAMIFPFLTGVEIVAAQDAPKRETPRIHDARLVVELFAAAPDIVHPVAVDVDAKGRVLVVESHTHFAPNGYKGPKFDRIRMLEDTKGAGKADRFTTFFEGTRHTMDLAVHPDGSVYIATRNEILRLRDTKGTGVADEKTRIVFLDTKGDYPHNGLSGLCFDSKGDLIFGMGENLGAAYKLIGADGTSFAGHGDGGHVFWCSADGKKLRRLATGFWNPFGTCRDIFGRLFTVDNDPDQMPPCRMLHVVEGADYGFQFRYGRSGKHPFQSWHGQLPGTLPMMTGVGEAPCEVLSYESDGLPKEYRGQLLVTSWADHRVERYAVQSRGASFQGERLPFVQGGKDFRPTGLATAPDGSLFVGDWVLSNYTLHGQGAIWHVRPKAARKAPRPQDPREAILSEHRPLRESAARELTGDKEGRELLRKLTSHADVRVRAAAVTALVDAVDSKVDLKSIADKDADPGMRALAVRAMVQRREDTRRFLDAKQPAALRAEAIKGLAGFGDEPRLLAFLSDADPFLRHEAVQQLARQPLLLLTLDPTKMNDVRQRIGVLLALRSHAHPNASASLKPFLADPEDEVRFLAAKWIADEKFADQRPFLVEAMKNPALNVRLYLAYATALARLDGQEVSETKLADYFVKRLSDDTTTHALRTQLLRQVPATHKLLTVELLGKLLTQKDDALTLEAVRALAEHPSPNRGVPLLKIFRDPKLSTAMRGQALIGLADRAQEWADELQEIARNEKSPLRQDASRALLGVKTAQGTYNRPAPTGRPPAKEIDAWLKRLEGDADIDAGARVFFHPKVGGCFRCHRVDGRGKDVGPDLSGIGRTDRRHILESILQPSNTVAPHYQVWHLETADGKTRTGMLIHTQLDEYTYLDARGGQFKINTRDIVETRPVTISIMPDGLLEPMTDQEIRDLLAYLATRK